MNIEQESVNIWRSFATKRQQFRHNPKGLQAAFFERLAFGMSDCWYWVGSRNDTGYGTFSSARVYGDSEIMAHRISWILFEGTIPADLNVLHICDVRSCVNPNHLFLGTQADNVHDMNQKGRGRSVPLPGEKNPMAKLTDQLVIELRKRHAQGGLSFSVLAAKFNISAMTAYRAVMRQSWKHI